MSLVVAPGNVRIITFLLVDLQMCLVLIPFVMESPNIIVRSYVKGFRKKDVIAMSDVELARLGIQTIGNRMHIRSAC